MGGRWPLLKLRLPDSALGEMHGDAKGLGKGTGPVCQGNKGEEQFGGGLSGSEMGTPGRYSWSFYVKVS